MLAIDLWVLVIDLLEVRRVKRLLGVDQELRRNFYNIFSCLDVLGGHDAGVCAFTLPEADRVLDLRRLDAVFLIEVEVRVPVFLLLLRGRLLEPIRLHFLFVGSTTDALDLVHESCEAPLFNRQNV